MKIKILSDSTCDLSQELLEKNNITLVPLTVIKNDEPFVDGVTITPAEIFAHVAAGGDLCSTTATNMGEYAEWFEKYAGEYDGVVHINIGSGFSSCYQNACIAAEEVGGVYVMDSRNLSTGIGLLVLRACELARQGMAAEVIVSAIREMAGRVDATFVPESLEFLKMGGRCSAAAALSASLLRIKPCIQVRDGQMVVGKKYTGNMGNVLMKYVSDRLSDLESVDLSRIFITHSGMSDPALVDKVKDAVLAIAPFEDVQVTRAGCTVSNHCGPNTLGVLFCKK